MTQQYGSGDFRPTVGKVDGTVNIYNPVIANSSNHQASTLSWLDEIYQTSVDDNPHQRSFMAPSSLLYVFPGPQTRVEVPDSKVAVQVDSMADGVQKNTHSGSASQTEVVPNSSDHERYKTEGTQIPMMQFGAKLFPDDCSYLPTSFKCSTSGSRWLHTKPEEENRASQTHNEGEQLATAPPSTPQDRGKRVERMAKKTYQCSSCQVIFTQRQGLSRHRKDKHEPKNRCGFCKKFTWSKGRHYTYQRHLREDHPDVVSPSVSVTMIARRRGV